MVDAFVFDIPVARSISLPRSLRITGTSVVANDSTEKLAAATFEVSKRTVIPFFLHWIPWIVDCSDTRNLEEATRRKKISDGKE